MELENFAQMVALTNNLLLIPKQKRENDYIVSMGLDGLGHYLSFRGRYTTIIENSWMSFKLKLSNIWIISNMQLYQRHARNNIRIKTANQEVDFTLLKWFY